MTSFAVHPYSAVVGLTGIDWSGKAGVPFYQSMLTWGLAPNALSCLGGGAWILLHYKTLMT